MYRAFLVLGAAIDLAMAAFLLLVAGWVVDSWHDRNAWAGPVVTACWALAFVFVAGAPILGWRLSRRQAPAGRVALAMWGPALLLAAITILGLILSPP